MNLTEFETKSEIKEASLILSALSDDKINQIVKDHFGTLKSIKKNYELNYIYGVDSGYNEVRINNGFLDLFISTPFIGKRGFIQDLFNDNKPSYFNKEDIEYLLNFKKYAELPKSWKYYIENNGL